MARRRWTAVAAVAIGSAVLAAAAFGAGRAAPPASALVLQPGDVPGGARVVSQRRLKASAPIVDEYERELAFATPYGASRFRAYFDVAFVFSSEPTADQTYALLERAYASPAARAELLKEFGVVSTAKQKVKLSHVVEHPVPLGDGAFELSLTATQGSKLADASVVAFRVDRVIEVAAAVGTGPVVHATESAALAKLVLNRVTAALSPASTSAPTVSGTAQQGQTLTASPGTWTNTPTAYAYQWQHCDASGANCTDVAGASGSTYAVTAADVGSTLRVNVTASNGVGASQPAASAATAVVS